jgi:aspartyl-tRNA(Asn)/glutamyl-tRNA(Gln) amidotransferase subunit C
MAVSEGDVRRVAELARVGLEPDRVSVLVAELNGILAHMDELRAADTSGVDTAVVNTIGNDAPLRADTPRTTPSVDIAAFAPQVADGFFLVPRLASHEEE